MACCMCNSRNPDPSVGRTPVISRSAASSPTSARGRDTAFPLTNRSMSATVVEVSDRDIHVVDLDDELLKGDELHQLLNPAGTVVRPLRLNTALPITSRPIPPAFLSATTARPFGSLDIPWTPVPVPPPSAHDARAAASSARPLHVDVAGCADAFHGGAVGVSGFAPHAGAVGAYAAAQHADAVGGSAIAPARRCRSRDQRSLRRCGWGLRQPDSPDCSGAIRNPQGRGHQPQASPRLRPAVRRLPKREPNRHRAKRACADTPAASVPLLARRWTRRTSPEAGA
jgi:hypothetical protein